MRTLNGLFLVLFTLFVLTAHNAAKGELPQVDNPPFPASNFRDSTDSLLNTWLGQGIALIDQRRVRNINLKLYTSPSAQAFIAQNKIVVKDLNNFIFNQFEASIKFFLSLNPLPNLNEIHLVICDYGSQEVASIAMPNTRMIEVQIGGWYKTMKTEDEAPTQVSSINAVTQVVNYMYAPNQSVFNRVFIGAMVQLLYLTKLYSDTYVDDNYLGRFTRPIVPMTLIDSENITSSNVIRAMAMALYNAIRGNSIQGPLEFTNYWHERKDLVLQMLRSQVKGKEMLNAACAKLQLRFWLKYKEQNIIEFYNYEYLKTDTREMFVRFPVNYQN